MREATLSAPGVWILPETIPGNPVIIAGSSSLTQARRKKAKCKRVQLVEDDPVRAKITHMMNLQP
jgi:hypothetical protein